MASPLIASIAPRKRQRLRADALDRLQHAPAQQSPSDMAAWLSQCDSTPPPEGASLAHDRHPHPAHQRKRRRILGEIQHNQKTVEIDGNNDRERGARLKAAPEARVGGTRRSTRLASLPMRPATTPASFTSEEVWLIESNAGPAIEEPVQPQRVPLKLPGPVLPGPVLPALSTISSSTWRSRSRSSSPSKRGPILKREDLQHLDPPIDVIGSRRNAQEYGVELPAAVAELWERCEQCTVTTLPRNPFFAAADKRDQQAIERTLNMALGQAEECRICAAPECQWIAKIIQPILNTLELLAFASRTSPTANDKIGVFDIRTVEMSPEYVPDSMLPTRFKDLDKKIDLAIGLQLHRKTKAALRTAQAKTDEPSKAINQASTFIHQNPLFLSIEVKRTYGGTDPMIQLAAWVAAEFIKREIEEVDIGMPALVVEIEGDYWRLYAVVATIEGRVTGNEPVEADLNANGTEGTLGLSIIGPVTLGSTDTWLSICRLYANLCCIVDWGRTVYLEWFEREVLGVYEKKAAAAVG
ncbi:uncharacterized protein BDZ99DRAFT_503586 [Mytilinidion resinicola]|uniref:PD-(D/E)XK nuclease-like domain-containing protein n=1 Tax=Mytilinidion resinicola TaxID=574789 RepID=A0A6A6Y263_9PEZI|nr:uncharacterized protein BDZ99DRAFT_503586 [Mytilinidion resinicola]KAF2802872.1 hypothetical protein BDZ99DRAFT_503586 [Mytilinidion resinicola]